MRKIACMCFWGCLICSSLAIKAQAGSHESTQPTTTQKPPVRWAGSSAYWNRRLLITVLMVVEEQKISADANLEKIIHENNLTNVAALAKMDGTQSLELIKHILKSLQDVYISKSDEVAVKLLARIQDTLMSLESCSDVPNRY